MQRYEYIQCDLLITLSKICLQNTTTIQRFKYDKRNHWICETMHHQKITIQMHQRKLVDINISLINSNYRVMINNIKVSYAEKENLTETVEDTIHTIVDAFPDQLMEVYSSNFTYLHQDKLRNMLKGFGIKLKDFDYDMQRVPLKIIA